VADRAKVVAKMEGARGLDAGYDAHDDGLSQKGKWQESLPSAGQGALRKKRRPAIARPPRSAPTPGPRRILLRASARSLWAPGGPAARAGRGRGAFCCA